MQQKQNFLIRKNNSASGKMQVKFFWKTGLLISIILSVIATVLLNLIIN
jgi:hypothetical protein